MNLVRDYLADLGTLYGPLILHMLPVSVHRTVVNAYNDINLKPLRPRL
jgi:hypothetical protein